MRYFFLSLFSLILLACGYSFQGSGSVLPPDIKTVYIADAENSTTESGLGRIITEALKDRFDRYATLRVVDNEYEADAVLSTKVIDFRRETRSVTSGTDNALQLETFIKVASSLSSITGLILWSNPNLTLSKDYGTAAGAVVTSSSAFASSGLSSADLSSLNEREIARGQETQVIEEMAETLAKKIYGAAVLPEF